MKKKSLLDAFASLQIDLSKAHHLVKKSFRKNSAAHEVRVFFKKLKAHMVLLQALWWEDLELSDTLHTYYKQIWLLRDAKIFRSLCETYTHGNKLIMVLGDERVVHAQDAIKTYKKTVKAKVLAEELVTLTNVVTKKLVAFDPKWIQAWIETFLEQTENMLHQLLQWDVITNVWFHTIRKHIKKATYLLAYMCLTDTVKYPPIYKRYKKFGDLLGEWNDLQLLVGQLEAMPRKWKEEKMVKKLVDKEEKARKEIMKKLRTYFHVTPNKVTKKTERVPSTESSEQKISVPVKSSVSAWTEKKPLSNTVKRPKPPVKNGNRQPLKKVNKPASTSAKPSVTVKKTVRKPAVTKKTPWRVGAKTPAVVTTPKKKSPIKNSLPKKKPVKKTTTRSPRTSKPATKKTPPKK